MIKITPHSKLLIWGSSPEVRSGGAEVLNMLAADLKALGVNCKMFNWSFPTYIQGDYYKNLYDINCGSWMEVTDEEDTIILLPESMFEHDNNVDWFISNFKHLQYIIWWLSTGNPDDVPPFKREFMNKLKSIEDRCLHVCESELAMRDLLYYGIENRMQLQHGINPVYYNLPQTCEKTDTILYNAMKARTRHMVEDILIPNMPDDMKDKYVFEAVRFPGKDKFRSKEDMCVLYDKSKLYIDFCDFTGRELMPREACVRNCALLLVNEGNVATFDDYPIPEEYKVSRYEQPAVILNKIKEIVDQYDTRIEDYRFFRNKCMYEPMKWEWELRNIFGPMIGQVNNYGEEKTND